MKRIAIIGFVFMLFVSGICRAQLPSGSVENMFENGNAAYNEGNYEQALTCYNSIVESGLESADLYYNMGNTYYKMKDYPKSILYYEKALKLDPSNEDVRTNLEIANLAIVDKITPIPQSFIAKWWNGLGSAFSADGWAWLSIISFALLLVCLFLFLMSRRMGLRKTGFFVGVLTLLCFGLSIFFALTRQRDMRFQDEAIIMTPTALVKSSPSENSVDLFVLHEGSKVRVMDGANGWNKIKIADGSVGWLQAENMIAF